MSRDGEIDYHDTQPRNSCWDGIERRREPTSHEVLRYIEDKFSQEKAEKFRIKSFSDLQAFISLAIILIGGIAWGLKLETRIESNTSLISECKIAIAKGILPITEERIISIQHRLDAIEKDHKHFSESREKTND